MNIKRFANDIADLHARVERQIGVLKDRLNTAAEDQPVALVETLGILTIKDDLSAGGIKKLEDAARDRGLATARFANQPEHFALANCEADVINRLHVANMLLKQHPLGDRKMHFQIADVQQYVVKIFG